MKNLLGESCLIMDTAMSSWIDWSQMETFLPEKRTSIDTVSASKLEKIIYFLFLFDKQMI